MSILLTVKSASGTVEVIDTGDFADQDEMGSHLYTLGLDSGEMYVPFSFRFEGRDENESHNAEGMGVSQVWEISEWAENNGEPFAVFLTLGVHDKSDPDSWEDDFLNVYQGEFSSRGDFAKDFYSNMHWDAYKALEDTPLFGCMDWEAYWEADLRHDYVEEGGFYFRNN